MPRVLLDTAAYLDIQRAKKHLRQPWAVHTLRHLASDSAKHGKPGLILLSVVEISAGFEEALRPSKLKTFLEVVLPMFELVDYGLPEACLTGELYRKLEAGRRRIGVADTAIAATAVTKGLTVVTSNTAHFQRIIDLGYPLALENWREA